MNTIRTWIRRHPVKAQRFLEILPGFTSWSLILFPVWGSFLIPELVAYYIIAFTVYWLYRSISVAILSTLSYFKLLAFQAYDWMGDVEVFPRWKDIHHIIVIPTYKEPPATLERTLKQLQLQTFPRQNLHIFVGFEEREGQPAREKAQALREQFGKAFGTFETTFHPDLPGEVKGKSSNTAWAAKEAKRILVDEKRIPINNITITSEDADAILHEQYFACLSYHFLDDPNRYYKIWQGLLLFYNNIWRVPFFVRVFSSISSVNHLYLLSRKDRLINFSTYSTSLKMIHEIGYWDTDVIPEDWRLFFKAFYHQEGKVSVQPIYLPVFADAAEAGSWTGTFVNQYEQVKRWAWGVSDDAYIIKNWFLSENVPFFDKTLRVLRVVEDHFLWPVNWFAITVGALLPPLLNKEFSRTMIGKTLPQVTSAILTICLLSLAITLILNFKLRPKDPRRWPFIRSVLTPLEFLSLPVVGFLFGALPGIDAHTRLMLGKYIEYRVTEKISPETS